MSTESIFEVKPQPFNLDDIVHTFCANSPLNFPEVTRLCCGSDPTGPMVGDDEPISCPMCAELEPDGTLTCACWW